MGVNQDPGWDDLQVGLPERGWRGERARTRVPAFRHHSTGQACDFCSLAWCICGVYSIKLILFSDSESCDPIEHRKIVFQVSTTGGDAALSSRVPNLLALPSLPLSLPPSPDADCCLRGRSHCVRAQRPPSLWCGVPLRPSKDGLMTRKRSARRKRPRKSTREFGND